VTRPFTQDTFDRLCYLPYNTVLTSFLAHGLHEVVDFAGMRNENEAEVEHRAERLSQHPELENRDWERFNAWLKYTERSFINQLEEGVVLGSLLPAKVVTDYEPVAWYVCKLDVTMMGDWPVRPVRPHWLEYPTAIGIVVT